MPERDETSQRTEQPTSLRRAEARRRGQVARSRELSAAAVGVTGVVLLGVAGPKLLSALRAMTASMLEGGSAPAADLSAVGGLFWSSVAPALTACGLVVLGLVAVAVAVNFAQVGALMAGERVRPDLSRLSFSQGVRRLFSLRSWFRVALGVVRMVAVAVVAWTVVRSSLGRIVRTSRVPTHRLAAEAGEMAWRLGMRVGAVLLALGLVDYLYQRWQHGQDLRMTRREVQDDLRQMEGAPLTRRRRSQGRREQASAGADEKAARKEGDEERTRGHG